MVLYNYLQATLGDAHVTVEQAAETGEQTALYTNTTTISIQCHANTPGPVINGFHGL